MPRLAYTAKPRPVPSGLGLAVAPERSMCFPSRSLCYSSSRSLCCSSSFPSLPAPCVEIQWWCPLLAMLMRRDLFLIFNPERRSRSRSCFEGVPDLPLILPPSRAPHLVSPQRTLGGVVSYRVLSCRVLSYLVLSCPVMSCLTLSCRVISCPVMSCLTLSCPVLSWPVLSYRRCQSCSTCLCGIVFLTPPREPR